MPSRIGQPVLAFDAEGKPTLTKQAAYYIATHDLTRGATALLRKHAEMFKTAEFTAGDVMAAVTLSTLSALECYGFLPEKMDPKGPEVRVISQKIAEGILSYIEAAQQVKNDNTKKY